MQVIRVVLGVLAIGCYVASVQQRLREMWQSTKEKDDARFKCAIIKAFCFSCLTGIILFSSTFLATN